MMHEPVTEYRQPASYDREQSLPLSHFVHVLTRYRYAIVFAVGCVILGSAIIAIAAYLAAPAKRITSIPFHLDFAGASGGQYPNGAKFSPTDINSTPILLRVYAKNQLGQFVTFSRFSRSVFILETNPAYERLTREYEAKLADTRLSPADVERLQNEFLQKKTSISRDEYSINYVEEDEGSRIPRSIIQKALLDVLSAWANQAVVERKVFQYRLAVLTSNILDLEMLQKTEPLVALLLLRQRAEQVLGNISSVAEIPGTDLTRTARDRKNLWEIRIELQDLIRYQIEPLIAAARAGTLVPDRVRAVRALEAQLGYDERTLDEKQAREAALRNALALYEQNAPAVRPEVARPSVGSPRATQESPTTGETVMPQLSESFLERIIDLTNRNADRQYRQSLVDQVTVAALAVIPEQATVTYERDLVNAFRQPGVAPFNPAAVEAARAAILDVYKAISYSIEQLNEIYSAASKQLNPVTELFSISAPVSYRAERAVSISRLGLFCLFMILMSLPLIVIAALVHNRIREEEAMEEEYARSASAAV